MKELQENANRARQAGIARQLNQTLRESESRYRQLVDNAPCCIHELDADGGFLSMNAAGLRMLALDDAASLIGLSYLDAVCAADRLRVAQLFQDAAAGEAAHFEFTAVNGKYFSSSFVPLAGGTIMGITQDLTERKQAEDKLRKSEERLRWVMEQAPAMVWAMDSERRINLSEGKGLAGLGLQPGKLVGMTLDEFLQTSDAENPLMACHLRAIQGQSVEYLTQWGGRVLECRLEPLKDAAGRSVGCLGVGVDVTERTHAEKALRESKERYQLIAELTSSFAYQASVTTDRQVAFEWISGKFHEVTGFRPEELTGQGWFSLVPAEDLPAVLKHVTSLRSSESDLSDALELRIRRRSGELRWLRSVVHPVAPSEPGGPMTIYGAVLDITERKRADAILAAEARVMTHLNQRASLEEILTVLLRAIEGLADGVSASVLLLDSTGRLRHGAAPSLPEAYIQAIDGVAVGPTEGSCGTAAYRREPVLVADIASDPLWVSYAATALSHGLRACWSTPILADGQVLGTFALYYREPRCPTEDELRLIERMTHLARIAIKRTRDETGLRESEERFQAFMGQSPVVAWIKDEAFRYRYANAAFEQLFDRPASQILGRTDYDLYGPDFADKKRGNDIQVLKSGKVLDTIESMPGADGRPRQWLVQKFPLNHSGQYTWVGGTAVDVTARTEAEAAVRKMEAQLLHAQKLESLGVLAGGIAHDFNNLLTVMLGYANLSKQKLPAESPIVPMLAEVENACRRAAELTRQLLAYAGKGKFEVEVLGLDAIVREMKELLETAISKRAQVELKLRPAVVEGDAAQIRQIVMNLITNASDALGDQAGEIQIRTGIRDCDADYIRSPFCPDELPAGRYAFVAVADSGCGMSEDTLKKIFDPFFTTKFTGRGLGLAAVLGIVRGHRGVIKVASTPGQGTIVEVLFPSAAGVAAERSAAGLSAPTRGTGLILVVEDDPIIGGLAQNVLETAGFSVLIAQDGQCGWEMFEQRRQDIVAILLDLTMPRMDGLELLRRIRALDPDLPALVMSGYGEVECSRRLAGCGASGFIQKPFQPQELAQRICRLATSIHS